MTASHPALNFLLLNTISGKTAMISMDFNVKLDAARTYSHFLGLNKILALLWFNYHNSELHYQSLSRYIIMNSRKGKNHAV